MNLLKNSFIYLSTEIINKAIPFLLLPIITKYLTPTEYGVYGMYQVLISFLNPFISMNLHSNITRNFFKVSKEELSKIISSIIVILHINVFIGLIVLYLITLFFHNPFGVPDKIIYILPIIIYAQMINSFNLTILRNEEKALKYGIIQIITTILNFSLTLLLLIVWHLGWYSLVYGVLFAQFVVMLYSFYSLKNEFNLFKNFYSFKEIYKISIPLIFHLLGGSIIFFSDRVFIQQMLGLKEVGLYSVGNQFGMITMIVINAIIMAINPWIYKSLSNNHNILKKLYLLMVGFLLLGIFIWLVVYFIYPFFIDSIYVDGRVVIFWISLAFVFRGWYQLYYNFLVFYGKTHYLMFITFFSGVLNIILNYLLIKFLGIVGAAISTAVAFLSMFLLVFFNIKKIRKRYEENC